MHSAVFPRCKRSAARACWATHVSLHVSFAGTLMSGGTRIRTGDTMIFSLVWVVRARPPLSSFTAYLSQILHFAVHLR
jgi:hypothetical protein